MYQASNISFTIGDKTILKNINLSVKPGEFTAIVGPNGAGKSSLIKILANEQERYKGSVTINGKEIQKYKPKELSQVRSVMPQNSNVHFAFSVVQIINLARYAHPSTEKENQRIVDEVMDLTGVSALRDRNYLTLSGGEKQRVQLTRVLAQVWEQTVHPRYILLDEPTSNMDIAQQQFMLSLTKNICSRNIGVMAIVHDLNLAVRFANHIYFMRHGEAVASGEAGIVFTKSNIEETFCCKVNVYHDPCSNCPYIIPEREFLEDRISLSK